VVNILVVTLVMGILTEHWMPLKHENGIIINFLFVGFILLSVLGSFYWILKNYSSILMCCLNHQKWVFIFPPSILIIGLTAWLGFNTIFGFLPNWLLRTKPLVSLSHSFPGLGKEFMPFFDEGAFLYMPSTMPHASIGEAMDVLQKLDKAIYAIPEVESVVGKIGRAETALDPAPVSMVETVVNVIPEYGMENGEHIRRWRPHIKSMDDIWNEIVKVAKIPGTTSAPKLMPIATRIVMLQSGMRAPMGIKVKGPDLESIEDISMQLEKILKEVPGVNPPTVFADRIIGKPYLEIDIDRDAIARYGLHIKNVQDIIEIGIGGKRLTTTVEGREFLLLLRFHSRCHPLI